MNGVQVTVFVTLDSGDILLVDLEDYEKVFIRNWEIVPGCGHVKYAKAGNRRIHREILGCVHRDGSIVDHRNGDGLDNRRCNLRLVTPQQNQFNKTKKRLLTGRNPDSGFKGVWWHRSVNKWAAGIRVENRNIHLGCFVDPKEAALIYDDAARKHFGEFARLNFPQPHEVGCLV